MFTVLILEDDTEQQKAITKILEEHYNKWILYTAATYKEACNLIETKNFDLFLLDIELNTAYIDDLDCDGLDFGKYIRSIKKYTMHLLYILLLFLTEYFSPFRNFTAVHIW